MRYHGGKIMYRICALLIFQQIYLTENVIGNQCVGLTLQIYQAYSFVQHRTHFCLIQN